MINKLFVYGTLGPGQANEHIMSRIGGCWEKGFVFGDLHNDGWGAKMGCPGIILNEKGCKVEGYLFISDNLKDYWPMLDEFEGEGYERVLTSVETDNNNRYEAYIYTLSNCMMNNK